MDERQILQYIHELVDEEHRLREMHERHELSEQQEQERMQAVEVALDQCWDLLRQRKAKRAVGLNPDDADVRPPAEVENYLQ